MLTNQSLGGLKVLVTRPKHQAANLCEKINALGGLAMTFPLIEIEPIQINNIASYQLQLQDIVIFVSVNAVNHCSEFMLSQLSPSCLTIAVGQATARAMQQCGLQSLMPDLPPFNSENVLTMSELNDVKDKNIMIVKGQGGRTLLAKTLEKRGAKVRSLDLYQRSLPSPNKGEVLQAMIADCIIISSVNSLDNLCQLLDRQQIKDKRLIVASERIGLVAKQYGFSNIDIADDAMDDMIMRKLTHSGG